MEDALQDAYLKAFRGLPRFRADASVSTWLYRIVYNSCLDALRRARSARETHVTGLEGLPDSEDDLGEAVGARGDLAAALLALPVEQRAAVLLVDGQGLSYDEAAFILGIPRGTVASRLGRARPVLRRVLTVEEDAR